MNIVYLRQDFNTREDSGGSRAYEFARRLVSDGHVVNMVTSARQRDASVKGWQESTIDGIRVHTLAVPYSESMPFWRRILGYSRFVYRAAARAARLNADLVFATSGPMTIALPGIYASWRRRVPMVLEVRDLWPELPIAAGRLSNPIAIRAARWLERFAYRHAAHIIALSPGMRDGIVATGYPTERVSVIPNAADLDLFCATPEDGLTFRQSLPTGDRPLVTYAGAIGWINGVTYIPRIAACARAKGSRVAFLIVGHGAERDAVRRTADELGVLNDNLFMIDSIPKTQMPLLLAATQVALSLFIDLPEMWNNSANKFFDALASGTPVAINYQGWQANLLRETGAGIVLPADDPAPVADTLIEFTGDARRLDAAGRAARALAEAQFSREQLYRQFESVLARAAASQ